MRQERPQSIQAIITYCEKKDITKRRTYERNITFEQLYNSLNKRYDGKAILQLTLSKGQNQIRMNKNNKNQQLFELILSNQKRLRCTVSVLNQNKQHFYSIAKINKSSLSNSHLSTSNLQEINSSHPQSKQSTSQMLLPEGLKNIKDPQKQPQNKKEEPLKQSKTKKDSRDRDRRNISSHDKDNSNRDIYKQEQSNSSFAFKYLNSSYHPTGSLSNNLSNSTQFLKKQKFFQSHTSLLPQDFPQSKNQINAQLERTVKELQESAAYHKKIQISQQLTCVQCKKQNFNGPCFQCLVCPNLYLCSSCELKPFLNNHPIRSHPFAKLKKIDHFKMIKSIQIKTANIHDIQLPDEDAHLSPLSTEEVSSDSFMQDPN